MHKSYLTVTLIVASLSTFGAAFKIRPRIVNGFNSKPGQFPYYAYLGIAEKDYEFIDKSCGGVVISSYWILSAAHCFAEAYKVAIYLGSTELYNNYEENRITIIVKADSIYIHKNYREPNLRDDIALIKLPYKIKFDKYIQPIELPSTCDLAENEEVFAVGNGRVNEILPIAPVLQWVPLTTHPLSLCKIFFNKYIGERKNILCAGDMEGFPGSGLCGGDSGD